MVFEVAYFAEEEKWESVYAASVRARIESKIMREQDVKFVLQTITDALSVYHDELGQPHGEITPHNIFLKQTKTSIGHVMLGEPGRVTRIKRISENMSEADRARPDAE
eukprot:gene21655-8346_t